MLYFARVQFNTVHILLAKRKNGIIIFPYNFSHKYSYCSAITIKGNDCEFARLAGDYMYDTEISSS